MSKNKNTFYITTPIYYVTAKPHLGSLYSTIIADTMSRFYKQRNKDVFFLTGTDEHGQKIAEAAAQQNQSPQVFVDSFIPTYKAMWQKYHIHYDYFMRTTDNYHRFAVQELLSNLINSGDIYKSTYEGWYCTPCETFAAQKTNNNETIVACPSCNRPTKLISEESYFFKLSSYTEKLLRFYTENPDFITPKERLQEVIQFVTDGLRDISISRTTVSWGIPFPNNSLHTVYVWIEALCNYITAIGYNQDSKKEMFQKFWPADIHVMGKDIVRFHAVYWPALLFAAKLPTPKKLLVHGWITVNHQKMSKSFNNVIDPDELAKKYHVDVIRYYLLRYLPINQDGDFSYQELEKHCTADLANDLGNLLQRTVVLYKKSAVLTLKPKHSALFEKIKKDINTMIIDFEKNFQNGMFHIALAAVWSFIKELNGFFHNNEPWKALLSDPNLCTEILWITCYGLYNIAYILEPIMPEKTTLILTSLGMNKTDKPILDLTTNGWNQEFTLTQISLLFEKYETEKKPMIEEKKEYLSPQSNTEHNTISFELFSKIELRVGTITHCVEVPKSTKLLLLTVNFGPHKDRQIVSGIKEIFKIQDLINKQALFAYNLEPKTIFGYESHGMILLASDAEGKKRLMIPEESVLAGTLLK